MRCLTDPWRSWAGSASPWLYTSVLQIGPAGLWLTAVSNWLLTGTLVCQARYLSGVVEEKGGVLTGKGTSAFAPELFVDLLHILKDPGGFAVPFPDIVHGGFSGKDADGIHAGVCAGGDIGIETVAYDDGVFLCAFRIFQHAVHHDGLGLSDEEGLPFRWRFFSMMLMEPQSGMKPKLTGQTRSGLVAR